MRTRNRSTAAPASARPAPPQAAPVRPAARLACVCGGRCPRCDPEAAARAVARSVRDDPAAAGHAEVRDGRLAPAQQRYFERQVGAPLDGVRLDIGAAATTEARRERAHGFAQGGRVVLGVAGSAPLLAHELAHVAQQRAGGVPTLQRTDDEYADEYHRPGTGRVSTYTDLSVAQYKRLLGSTESAAKGVASAHRFALREPITPDELARIFPDFAADAPAEVFGDYLERLNAAFRLFKIDSVEAQAAWLANAMHESAQFRTLTETAGTMPGNAPYEQDPSKTRLDTSWLDDAAAGRKKGIAGYELGGTIRPKGGWDRSFIGRGPVQLTHRHGYLQALIVMEHRAEELEADGIDPDGAAALREAVAAIRADPREAANPTYTFLFSMAALKMPFDATRNAGQVASGGSVTGWMGPQPAAVKEEKEAYYATIKAELMKKYLDEKQRAAAKATAAATR